MDDLTKYRLENFDWCKKHREKMGAEKFIEFTDAAYRLGADLNPGSFFRVREWCKKPENYDLFIKSLCYLILYPPPGAAFLFSDDYEIFRRVPTYEEVTQLIHKPIKKTTNK
ncbi:MAG: hypothetical protein RR346_06075 [Bacteroidales bacterium]